MIVQRHGWLIASSVLASYFALNVGANGIPALRHDWFWPLQWGGTHDVFLAAAGAWQTQGIGSPNPFVNNYLLVAFLVPLEALFGAYGALLLFLFGVALAISLSARALAIVFGANELLAMVAAGFALFNPWTYTEIVAGHGAMLVAYAATMALLAEAMRPAPRTAVCAAATAFTLPQLQFFAPSLAIVAGLAAFRHRWLPLATWVVAGAANFIGIAFAVRAFARTPLTQAWEQTQSLAPIKAVLLSGYFARYADGYDHFGAYAVACIAALALVGCAQVPRSKAVIVTALLTALVLVTAMGVRGPFASILPFLYERFPAIGLYRELYDLIGYVVIGYVILGVTAASRHALFAGAFAAATAALALLWTWHSPTHFWVDRRSLPQIPVVALPNTRIALLPAFQPLSYRGSFSGLDPDAYPRADGVTALNESVPAWPGDAALASYARDGDVRSLAALSVTEIASRPWYSMTTREFEEQIALPIKTITSSQRVTAPLVAQLTAVPIVSLIRTPPAVAIADRIGGGAVFFGDIANFAPPNVLQPSKRYVHAADGWVDARLAFAVYPELAQPFGGALTTSHTDVLALPAGGHMLLVFVKGRLLAADSRILATSTGRLRWIDVPSGVSAVRCQGLCEVVLQGDVPPNVPDNVEAPVAQPVAAHAILPWLVAVTLPAGDPSALRYNIRYDEHWTCSGCPPGSAHVSLDATVNGWLLGARSAPTSVYLVEWVALLQTIAQVLGLVWILIVLIRAAFELQAQARRPLPTA
jgi:hypothetical protein